MDLIEVLRDKGQRTKGLRWVIGGSYVSKYEANDTILKPIGGQMFMYNLPRWIGAGDVRTEVQYKGFRFLAEYARKANDPTLENGFSYQDGEALLLSASYSQKGLAVLLQAKRSDNMSFRSERLRTGIAGRLNHMPAFAQQHTYALAALYPYATQYAGGEWAFQAEIRYTFAKKTKMGGKYGTTLTLTGSHVRLMREEARNGEAYTDIHLAMHKRLSKNWWLNAMVM